MKSYGLTKFDAADCDVAGLLAQGAPTRYGVRQKPKSKAAARRRFKRLARKAGKAECQNTDW